jgi:signal transduction histidine kinase
MGFLWIEQATHIRRPASRQVVCRWQSTQDIPFQSFESALTRVRTAPCIDDITDFARGRLGGGFGANIQRTHNLGPALEQVVAELRSAHPSRSVDVAIDVNEPVHCDAARVEQLASNLLANALFYGTPTAPAFFTATVQEDKLVITVLNQGAPIPAESIPSLSDAFTQGTHRSPGGLGLGLFICAQVVKAHKGTLDVTSSEEQETVFTAKLPLSGPPPASRT